MNNEDPQRAGLQRKLDRLEAREKDQVKIVRRTDTIFGGSVDTDRAVEAALTPLLAAVKFLGPKRCRYVGMPANTKQLSKTWGNRMGVWTLDGRRATFGQLMIAADKAGMIFTEEMLNEAKQQSIVGRRRKPPSPYLLQPRREPKGNGDDNQT